MRFLFSVFSFLFSVSVYSQEWNLKQDEDGIKVFTRLKPGSEYEDVRCAFKIKARLSSFTAMLKDLEGYTEWAFNCVEANLIKTINDTVQIFYTHTSLPWPANDRDFILRMTIKQDPHTLTVKTNSYCVPGFVKEKEGIVRITNLENSWKMTPKFGGFLEVDYFVSLGPGGDVPAWLINATVTYGPIQSLQKVRKILEEGKYKNSVFWFVKELEE